MKFVIINGNPKKDGLCFSVMERIIDGAKAAGADVDTISPDDFDRCHVCGDGWGSCLELRRCDFEDDGFKNASNIIAGADAICIISPVYWHEMAEGVKGFIDRLRRCERGEEGRLAGKSVLLVASAGGTGNGIVNCLHQMEQFCKHTRMNVFDFIGVNRWNADYKRDTAYAASRAMAEGRTFGSTV